MHYLFEQNDYLDRPIECFYFNSADEDFPIRPHWHYFMEIILMLDGTAEMRDGENSYIVDEGDMIIFHPKSVHSIFAVDERPLKYAVIKFDINRLNLTPAYAPKLRSIFRHAEKNRMNIFFPAEITSQIKAEEIIRQCINEMYGQEYGYELIVQGRIYQLLIDILRIWQDNGFVVGNEVFKDDDTYTIYNITEFIDSHLNDGTKITDIAKECGMSYSYFAKKFLSVYGKTCKEYIEEMRVIKVEDFLLFTDFDLNYISQETGFSDCSHMIKCFKRHKGITPKKFRQHKPNHKNLS